MNIDPSLGVHSRPIIESYSQRGLYSQFMRFYMDLHLVTRELVVTGVDGDAKSKLLWKQEIHIKCCDIGSKFELLWTIDW